MLLVTYVRQWRTATGNAPAQRDASVPFAANRKTVLKCFRSSGALVVHVVVYGIASRLQLTIQRPRSASVVSICVRFNRSFVLMYLSHAFRMVLALIWMIAACALRRSSTNGDQTSKNIYETSFNPRVCFTALVGWYYHTVADIVRGSVALRGIECL